MLQMGFDQLEPEANPKIWFASHHNLFCSDYDSTTFVITFDYYTYASQIRRVVSIGLIIHNTSFEFNGLTWKAKNQAFEYI